MDVGDLRKRILRALDDARKDAAARRQTFDAASADYAVFLETIAAPLFRQAASVLRAEGVEVVTNTPAGSVRLAVDRLGHTFVELELDSSGEAPEVIGRTSFVRGGHGQAVLERPLARDKAITDLTDDDVARFLVEEVPRLIARP